MAELLKQKSTLEREKLELIAKAGDNVAANSADSSSSSPLEAEIEELKAQVTLQSDGKIEQYNKLQKATATLEAMAEELAAAKMVALKAEEQEANAKAAAVKEAEVSAAAGLEADSRLAELEAAKQAVEAAEAEKKQLEDELELVSETKAFLEAQASGHAEEVQGLRSEVEKKQAEVGQLKAANDKATADALELQAELLKSAEAGTGSAERMARLQAQLAEQASKLAAKDDEATRAERRCEDLAAELKEAEKRFGEEAERLSEAEALHAAVVADLQGEVASLRAATGGLEVDKERLAMDLKNMTEDRDEVAAALAEVSELMIDQG